jgi:DNA polymerase-4
LAARQTLGLCLKRVDLSRRIRLLGVRVGKLVKPGTEGEQASGYSESHSTRNARDKASDEHTDLLFPELD